MLRAFFTLLFLQNEDVVHAKQHIQEQYVSDMSIDTFLKAKNAKSNIIFFKCQKDVQTHTQITRKMLSRAFLACILGLKLRHNLETQL